MHVVPIAHDNRRNTLAPAIPALPSNLCVPTCSYASISRGIDCSGGYCYATADNVVALRKTLS